MENFIYFIVLFIIILYFSYINSIHNVEEFTPIINKMYRPHVRNVRIIREEFYGTISSNISNLFRKFGIM
jgi:hypothetical protein